MNKMTINDYQKLINDNIYKYLPECASENNIVSDAMKYSLSIGGKRIRPMLVLEFCRVCGGDINKAMPFAAALEMIHTYSLIHDDLPCMDNDDMRRGKPTNHIVYGYSTALLAGDALLTKAFLTASENPYATPEMKAAAVSLIAEAAGECGMIGGQVIDLSGEERRLDFEELLTLHRLKTGALIKCAARLGALSAGYFPGSEKSEEAAEYAAGIGLAFQVIDDILDVTATEAELGKSIGSDAQNNKTTFLTYYSVEEAAEYAKALTDGAVEKIAKWDNNSTNFIKLL